MGFPYLDWLHLSCRGSRRSRRVNTAARLPFACNPKVEDPPCMEVCRHAAPSDALLLLCLFELVPLPAASRRYKRFLPPAHHRVKSPEVTHHPRSRFCRTQLGNPQYQFCD